MFGWKLTRASQSDGDGKGAGLCSGTGGGGQGPFSLSRCKWLVSDGFLHSLSMCKRGFHDLLKVRPSSWVSLIRSTPTKTTRLVSVETSALKAQTPGDHPKNHNTAFNTRRKFEIKISYTCCLFHLFARTGKICSKCVFSCTCLPISARVVICLYWCLCHPASTYRLLQVINYSHVMKNWMGIKTDGHFRVLINSCPFSSSKLFKHE